MLAKGFTVSVRQANKFWRFIVQHDDVVDNNNIYWKSANRVDVILCFFNFIKVQLTNKIEYIYQSSWDI
jgi:hypothetical protein